MIEISESLKAELKELSDYIYDNPELGMEEYKSAKAVKELLMKHGFTIEDNYCGMETAFKATFDSGKSGATVAYLAEYDALPKIGHGCGHNMIAASSVGAGIVLSQLGLSGKVVVFGTPAEENFGGKVIMAEADGFRGIDVAIEVHPANNNYKSGSSSAMEALQFAFKGKTAHAAADPEKGINALDGVIATFNNINALREHIRSDARVHGIIKDGGEAANVVPDYAVGQFYVRAAKKEYLAELREKVINCAKAGALASGAELTVSNYEATYDNLVTNETLSAVYNKNAAQLGVKMVDSPEGLGSTDVGNVSQVVPTIHPYFQTFTDSAITGHSVEFRNATKTDFAYHSMFKTIEIMVQTGKDVMVDENLLSEIKAEFLGKDK